MMNSIIAALKLRRAIKSEREKLEFETKSKLEFDDWQVQDATVTHQTADTIWCHLIK